MLDLRTGKGSPLNTNFFVVETLIGNVQHTEYKNSKTNSTRKCKNDLDFSKVDWNGKSD